MKIIEKSHTNPMKWFSLVCLSFSLLIITSCSDQNQDPIITTTDYIEEISDEEIADAAARIGLFMKTYDGSLIQLEGVQNYFTLALNGSKVLQDHDNPCDVTLEFLEGNEIMLSITEYLVNADGTPALDENGNQIERKSTLLGKMTKGGVLKVSYPVPFIPGPNINLTDIIEGHTGCELFGPGIQHGTLVFTGYFDGEYLKASAHFMSKCDIEWEANDIFPTPVDGPVKWKWSLELKNTNN